MDAPIYSQAEADAMLAMEKVAAYESQAYHIGRYREGFRSTEFAATGVGDAFDVKFKIIVQANLDIQSYGITLEGSMGGKPFEGLCRYDVHDTPHPNKPNACGPPAEIPPGFFHVHRYCEKAIRKRLRWDACAEFLPIAEEQDLRAQLHQLIGSFVADMRLSFSDSATMFGLFETGNP